jgi:tRNA(Ile)-lysidine synthase
VADGGLPLAALAQAELRPRAGAERFQRTAGSTARSLKKQYQAAGVAAWQRNAPLLYCEGRLAYVPGLGIDARALAPAGVSQVSVQWRPASAGAAGNP